MRTLWLRSYTDNILYLCSPVVRINVFFFLSFCIFKVKSSFSHSLSSISISAKSQSIYIPCGCVELCVTVCVCFVLEIILAPACIAFNFCQLLTKTPQIMNCRILFIYIVQFLHLCRQLCNLSFSQCFFHLYIYIALAGCSRCMYVCAPF